MSTPTAISLVSREASIANEDKTSMNVIQMASVVTKSYNMGRAMGTMVNDFAGHGEIV